MHEAPSSRGIPALPQELRLHILSLLPPNDLALGGRLSCKDAAQHSSQPHHCTVSLEQPLPGWVVGSRQEGAEAALRQLTFLHKLCLLSRAAGSSCEANVEFVLQLLQPHLFPELLQWEHYSYNSTLIPAPPDLGSAVVTGGLAHLLPSLAQRCPALLDPERTLAAAARHCDLAGRRAAWALLGQRLQSSIDREAPERFCLDVRSGEELQQQQQQPAADEQDKSAEEKEEWEKAFEELDAEHRQWRRNWLLSRWRQRQHDAWRRIMAGAASSTTPDAIAKMQWVLWQGGPVGRAVLMHEDVCGAAAASGDLSRVYMLYEHGYAWGHPEARMVLLEHAGLGFIQRMEEDGYLQYCEGGAGNVLAWSDVPGVVSAAASAKEGSVAKLRWLAERGVVLAEGAEQAVMEAAREGNLGAVQLLVDQLQTHGGGWDDAAGPAAAALVSAVNSGHVATAAWLREQGCALSKLYITFATIKADLPMLRWLVEEGCPRDDFCISDIVSMWSSETAAQGRQLVEAVRMLRAAGWPLGGTECVEPYVAAAQAEQPWAVWRELQQLLPWARQRKVSADTAGLAARAGCEATLEALVQMDMFGGPQGMLQSAATATTVFNGWYVAAAKNGDLGTLSCLRRLGVPLGEGLLCEAVKERVPVPALQWLVAQGAPVGYGRVREMVGRLQEWYLPWHEREREDVEWWLRGLLRGAWEPTAVPLALA